MKDGKYSELVFAKKARNGMLQEQLKMHASLNPSLFLFSPIGSKKSEPSHVGEKKETKK